MDNQRAHAPPDDPTSLPDAPFQRGERQRMSPMREEALPEDNNSTTAAATLRGKERPHERHPDPGEGG
eukprot:2757712-Alexandrium_andersonii.AAC.1